MSVRLRCYGCDAQFDQAGDGAQDTLIVTCPACGLRQEFSIAYARFIGKADLAGTIPVQYAPERR